MVPRRTKKINFPKVFLHAGDVLFQFHALIITFWKHRFSVILKIDFSYNFSKIRQNLPTKL